MTLRKKIEMLYTYAGMSQAACARAVGMTPATFNARLKAEKFSFDELQKLAETCGASVSVSFTLSDNYTI